MPTSRGLQRLEGKPEHGISGPTTPTPCTRGQHSGRALIRYSRARTRQARWRASVGDRVDARQETCWWRLHLLVAHQKVTLAAGAPVAANRWDRQSKGDRP